METIIWFKNKCVKDIEKAIELKKQGKIVVMDTYWVSNDLHITTLTKDFEQEILLEKAKLIANYLPKPDVVIFLDASEEKIRKLILERNRDFDTNESYIKRILSIKKSHEEFLENNKESLIYINRDGLDFEKQEDLSKIIVAIMKK